MVRSGTTHHQQVAGSVVPLVEPPRVHQQVAGWPWAAQSVVGWSVAVVEVRPAVQPPKGPQSVEAETVE